QNPNTYPIEFFVDDFGTSLGLTAQVMHPLSPARICEYMQRALGELLDVLESKRDTPIQTLDILPKDERQLLLRDWNLTQESYPDHLCLHHLFELQVERTPGTVAVVHGDVSITYAELNVRANSLAHRLLTLGVQPDDLVAICVERSPAMIIGILAILKAGGAYVPLDPFYASDRLRDIIADASPKLLLADQGGKEVLGENIISAISTVDPTTQEQNATENPQDPELTPQHLAYIIYTSGSTGKPKGVMVEHQGVVSLVQYHSELIGVHEGSRMLQFASISFDFSVWEIFLALCSGATLVLAPSSMRMDRDLLWNYMIQHSVTHATFTPSFLQDGQELPRSIESLTLTLGGEALGPTLLQNLIRQGITVFNDYGPTEASISAATWKCPTNFEGDIVPIGRAVRNAQLYVLDDQQQPVLLGAVGELYISGLGLARGYLNKPEQTAERFIKDPFSSDKDARMYRTGDLVRYLPDGNLVYLGRTDHQVKIRGFRIELGEIEAALTDHKWVSEAAVLALGSDNDKHLVAYVVSDPRDQLPCCLRAHLLDKLPQYMVPAAYVRLDAMPRTANEKLDRKALPVPDEDSYAREAYEAPQGEVEIKLAEIWKVLLQLEYIGRHDNFFALGGHSLLAAKMLDQLRRIGLSVSVRALFELPTLSALAKSVKDYQAEDLPPNPITPELSELTPKMLPLIALNQSDIDHIVQRIPEGVRNIQDIYPLTPLQDGILFHHLLATKGDPYLLTATIAFETRLLLDRYLDAFQTVVNRHDILRTAFLWEDISSSVQVVCRHAPLIIQELSIDPAKGPLLEQLDQRFNPKHYRIDLSQAPLLRFIIAQDTDGKWILVQLVHHLIGDHTAEEEIHAEIKVILDGESHLLPVPLHFRDHLAQTRLKSSPEEHERFFREMLGDVDGPTLPFGLTAVSDGGAEVEESYQVLPQELNDRLRALAKHLQVSLAAICHVAWAQVLARTSKRERVVFGTVLFGRLQGGDGSGHALGLSMNTLPIRCDIGDSSALKSVQDMHHRLTALLEHDHASLALAQRCSGVAAGTPLFSGLLNFRHSTPLSTSGTIDANGRLISQEGWFEYPGLEFLHSQERTNYPFSISMEDYGTALGLTAQTVQPHNPDRVCGYMQEALKNLASALESNSKISIAQLNVLPAEERTLLFDTWNDTAEDYSEHLCLHQLFEQQAERTHAALAVVCEDKSLTYRELNARSNGLARHPVQLGVRTDQDIVIPCNLITPSAARITPEMLPLIDLRQPDIDRIVERVPGGVANIQDIYALSPLQDGILFHHLMSRNGDPYLIFVSMSFDTRVSLDRYLEVIQKIVDRHDILRTAFVLKDLSVPAQVVCRDTALSITELELDAAAGTVTEQLKRMFDPRSYRMDLTQAPLLRFVVAQEADGSWVLVELLHHLIGDHSTRETMQQEIQAFFRGEGHALPPAQPYRNLIAQARLGVGQEEHEKFFTDMLGDIDTPSLPFGIADIHGSETQVSESGRMLPQDLNDRLRLQAKRLGVSVASLCHVAWALVIARSSGQERVVFGTVLFGRLQAAANSDRAMGLFINTLPIRVDLDRVGVEESVRVTHSRLAALLEHEHASLALAQRCSGVGAGLPLYSSLLNYRHNAATSKSEEIADGMEVLEFHERSNYPLCLSVEDDDASLGVTTQVVKPLDGDRVCGYMQEALASLAEALEGSPDMIVSRLEMLPKEERQLLLKDWNSAEETYPDHLCLQHLFELQVERTPGAVAVVHQDESLSYAELNNRANSLAHQLIALGLQPDSLVAICVQRSPEMIIGIIAILKAGGAYVPLDPSHASDRLLDILREASPVCLVADQAGLRSLGSTAIPNLPIVDPHSMSTHSSSKVIIPSLNPRHLAYIVFTSGTTGKPKGVMVDHQAVVSYVVSQQQTLQMQPSSRMAQLFSIGFDASVLEAFGTLCFGGSLHLLQDDVRMDI
ncbi:hypothetical protein EC968_008377, partial [Mortierella alpina]